MSSPSKNVCCRCKLGPTTTSVFEGDEGNPFNGDNLCDFCTEEALYFNTEVKTCNGLNNLGCPFSENGEQPLAEGFGVCTRCEGVHFGVIDNDDREDVDNIPCDQVVGRQPIPRDSAREAGP